MKVLRAFRVAGGCEGIGGGSSSGGPWLWPGPGELLAAYSGPEPQRSSALSTVVHCPPLEFPAETRGSSGSNPALRKSKRTSRMNLATSARSLSAAGSIWCSNRSSSSGAISVRMALAISNRTCGICGTALKMRGSGCFICVALRGLPARQACERPSPGRSLRSRASSPARGERRVSPRRYCRSPPSTAGNNAAALRRRRHRSRSAGRGAATRSGSSPGGCAPA